MTMERCVNMFIQLYMYLYIINIYKNKYYLLKNKNY